VAPPGPEHFTLEVLRAEALLPAAVLESAAWQQAFLPLLQADLATDGRLAARLRALAASLQPQQREQRQQRQQLVVSCPVFNFCGVDDPASACDRAAEWALVTSSPCVLCAALRCAALRCCARVWLLLSTVDRCCCGRGCGCCFLWRWSCVCVNVRACVHVCVRWCLHTCARGGVCISIVLPIHACRHRLQVSLRRSVPPG
jgi:hypothetical protein